MATYQPARRPRVSKNTTTVRRRTRRPSRRRRLPRLTLGWLALTLFAGYILVKTYPMQSIAAVVVVATIGIVCVIRPRRLAGLFTRVDRLASRRRARSAIPRHSSLARLQVMHHDRFENAVTERAAQSPYVTHAIRTGQTRDRGCDAIVQLTDSRRVLLQYKRYNPKNKIGGPIVRETAGAVRQAGCDYGIVVTTSDFTPEAHTAASALGVVLANGPFVAEWMSGGRAPWEPAR